MDLARAIVSHSSDGLVVLEADGTLRYSSPAADTMLGYAPGATVGTNAFDLVHPDDQVGALEGFASTMGSSDSRPTPLLVRLRRADGGWQQTEIIATNHLEDETVRGLLLNIRDVERSMRTEEALRQSEAQHRLIVELAREGIWTVDAAGKTTFANRAMAEMLDTTVTEMLESRIFDFMDAETRAAANDHLDRFKTGMTEEHDVELTTRTGRRVWTRMNMSPITDHVGMFLGAVALVTDVTERRMLEQRLEADARQDALTGVANRTALFEIAHREARNRAPRRRALHRSRRVQERQRRVRPCGRRRRAAHRRRPAFGCRAHRRPRRASWRRRVRRRVRLRSNIRAKRSRLGWRIRDVLQRRVSLSSTHVDVGASVGIAFVSNADADTLLSEADQALYCAKRSGRGRVELSTNTPTSSPATAAASADWALSRIERSPA